MTSHRKPGVAFWATVVLVVALVGYPLSFGPACVLISMRHFRDVRRGFPLVQPRPPTPDTRRWTDHYKTDARHRAGATTP
jgi:hypothetical protein